MKKEKEKDDVSLYEAPLIETVEVRAEKGVLMSPGTPTSGDEDGDDPWGG